MTHKMIIPKGMKKVQLIIPSEMRICQTIENFKKYMAGKYYADSNSMDIFYLSDKDFKESWDRFLRSLKK